MTGKRNNIKTKSIVASVLA